MKMKTKMAAVAMAVIIPSSAMANDLVGTLLGGAGGAAIGAQFGKGNGKLVTTAVGTLLGAGIGNSVSQSMARGDAAYYNQQAGYQPQPVVYQQPQQVYTQQVYREEWHEPAPRRHWKHKRHQNVYTQNTYINEQYAYAAPQEEYCREFTNNVRVGGRIQSSYGTACLQPDGAWKVVDSR